MPPARRQPPSSPPTALVATARARARARRIAFACVRRVQRAECRARACARAATQLIPLLAKMHVGVDKPVEGIALPILEWFHFTATDVLPPPIIRTLCI